MFKPARLIATFINLAFIFIFGLNCLTVKQRPLNLEPSLHPLKKQSYKIIGRAQTSASNFTLFWLYPVTSLPNIDTAIERAVRLKEGDDLIDVRLYQETQNWPVGSIQVIHIKGKVIKYDEIDPK